ncbi:MAG: cytochrome c553 [Halieaceae bacterium]|jgi:cytochrome c553
MGYSPNSPADRTKDFMVRLTNILLLAVMPLLPALTWAGGNSERGKNPYTVCAACHGDQAQGNSALNAPRLNHLAPDYLAGQLEKFKSGQRGGAGGSLLSRQMAPMAATLVDAAAMADVSTYIVSLSGGPSKASIDGDAVLGGDFYNQLCGACHGARAEGNLALNSPRLAGTDDWYLAEQLRAFRAGERGAHADDRTGKQMRAISMVLPDDVAIADVVAFLRSLEP